MFTEKGGLKSCSARQHHILWGRTGCKLSRGGEKKLRAQARRTGEPQLTLQSWWVVFLFHRGKEKDEPYFKCVKDFFFIRWDFFYYYLFFLICDVIAENFYWTTCSRRVWEVFHGWSVRVFWRFQTGHLFFSLPLHCLQCLYRSW